jgi:hypothetical protein
MYLKTHEGMTLQDARLALEQLLFDVDTAIQATQ